MSVWNELDIRIPPKKTYFQHPCNSDLQIFVFADAPHLLKLLRNHFLNHGFNMEGQIIHTKPIKKLLAINCNDLKVVFAISKYHLNVQSPSDKKFSLPYNCCQTKRLRWNGVAKKVSYVIRHGKIRHDLLN